MLKLRTENGEKRLGAYEAKTKLAEVLDRVKDGEEFVIERNGEVIARIVPAKPAVSAKAKAAAERILARLDKTPLLSEPFEEVWEDIKRDRDERLDKWL